MPTLTTLVRTLTPLLFLAGCTIQRGGPPAGGAAAAAGPTPSAAASDNANSPTATPATATGTSCTTIATCLEPCADGDEACANACIAKGSAPAKAKMNAIRSCIDQHACADEACLETQCKTEVDACRADTGPTPPAPSGGGSVPPELVGTWGTQSGGAMIIYTFGADGSFHEVSGLSSSGTCPLTTSWDVEGTVVFAATTVTFNRTSGTTSSQTCSESTKSTKPITPSSESKSWVLEAGTLYTWGSDCTDYKTCAVQLTK